MQGWCAGHFDLDLRSYAEFTQPGFGVKRLGSRKSQHPLFGVETREGFDAHKRLVKVLL